MKGIFECFYRKSNVFVEKAIISVDQRSVRSVQWCMHNVMIEKCNTFPAYTHRTSVLSRELVPAFIYVYR